MQQAIETGKFLFVIMILSLIAGLPSCGYRMTEDDKFPDMTVFPAIADSSFEVIKFPNNYYSVLGVHDGLLYVTYNITNSVNNGYSGTPMFALFNKSFDEVKSFELRSYDLRSDRHGDLYNFQKDSVRKLIYPQFKATDILNFPHTHYTLQREFEDTLQKLEAKDPDFNPYMLTAKELKRKIINFKPGVKPEYIMLFDAIILVYDDEEYYLDDFHRLDFSGMKKIGDFEEEYKERIHGNKLSIFDEAVLKNESTGNHYTASFYQSGFEYFNLVLEGDTTKFKFPSKSLNRSLVEVPSFDSPNEILIMTEERELYLVKKK